MKVDLTKMGKDYQKQLELLVKEFSNSDSPITLKMLAVEEFAKTISNEIKVNPDLEEKIDVLLGTIEPTDFSAKRLKLELANFLRRPEIIIEFIQTEEKLLIKRALQFSWMFKAGSSRLTNPKFLVEHLFPKVSYSVRTRIIYRLSKFLNDEKLCEVMFKTIENKYGWSAVKPLVPFCNSQFIKFIMERNGDHIQFTDTQLFRIARKDTKLALVYLRHDAMLRMRGRRVGVEWKNTFKYLIQKEPKEFIGFYEEHHGINSFLASEKGTEILIKTDPATVIKTKGKLFSQILCSRKVSKILTLQEMKDYFALLLPKSPNKFKHQINGLFKWIRIYPSKTKLEIIRYAFEKVYERKLAQELEYMTPVLVELLVNELEERERIVDWKLEDQDVGRVTFDRWENLPKNQAAFWYSFYSVEKGVGKIKELLSIEPDVSGRSELVPLLVNICWRNGKDTKALTAVCKYFANRFRNDHYQVRLAFMNALKEKFNLMKFINSSKEAWIVYLELVKLMILDEQPEVGELLTVCIHYSLKNDLPVDSLLAHFLKFQISHSYYFQNGFKELWTKLEMEPELQTRFLNHVLEYLIIKYPLADKPLQDLDSDVLSFVFSLTQCIYDNNRKPKMSITSLPWLFGRVQEVFESDSESNFYYQKIFAKYIGCDTQARDILYENLLSVYPNPDVVNYYVRKDPVKLVENLDSVLLYILHEKNIKEYVAFLMRIKTQGFPDLGAKIVEKCLETAQDDNVDIIERKNSIKILSLLWEAQNCLNLIAYFYPSQSKVDVSEENYETIFEMRKAIAISLSNIAIPVAAFQSVSRFCVGDYLKLTVGSLQSVCLLAPQFEALRFLKEELLDRPVSVKKHTIRLVCKISLKDELPEFLSYLWENEMNVSIREAILCQLFRLLSDRPSKETWELLKTSIESLTDQDKACLQELCKMGNITAIPKEYLSSYLNTCWKMLDSGNGQHKDINMTKVSLIQYMIPETKHLPREFLDSFIKGNLFSLSRNDNNHQADILIAISSLSAKYLTILDDSVKTISEALLKLGGSEWSSTEYVKFESNGYEQFDNDDSTQLLIPIFPAQRALYNFVIDVCRESFCTSEKLLLKSRFDALASFSKLMMEKLKVVDDCISKMITNAADIFTERFLLSLTIIFHDQSHLGKLSSSSTVADKKSANEMNLFACGKTMGKLFDYLVTNWSASILELVCVQLELFFEKCYYDNVLKSSDVVFLAEGILNCDSKIVSPENLIIISKLLPLSSPSEAACNAKYKELYKVIMNSPHKTVRASMLHRISSYY